MTSEHNAFFLPPSSSNSSMNYDMSIINGRQPQVYVPHSSSTVQDLSVSVPFSYTDPRELYNFFNPVEKLVIQALTEIATHKSQQSTGELVEKTPIFSPPSSTPIKKRTLRPHPYSSSSKNTPEVIEVRSEESEVASDISAGDSESEITSHQLSRKYKHPERSDGWRAKRQNHSGGIEKTLKKDKNIGEVNTDIVRNAVVFLYRHHEDPANDESRASRPSISADRLFHLWFEHGEWFRSEYLPDNASGCDIIPRLDAYMQEHNKDHVSAIEKRAASTGNIPLLSTYLECASCRQAMKDHLVSISPS